MSPVAVVWLVVGVCTLLVLVIFMFQLVKQVKRLTGSVVAFQREIQPVLEEIQRDAAAVQERSQRIQAQAEALSESRNLGSTGSGDGHRR